MINWCWDQNVFKIPSQLHLTLELVSCCSKSAPGTLKNFHASDVLSIQMLLLKFSLPELFLSLSLPLVRHTIDKGKIYNKV